MPPPISGSAALRKDAPSRDAFRPADDAAPQRHRRRGHTVAAVLAFLLLGAAHIHALRFTYDDAYISYRYAANLAHGHGLVYNPGEAVEGYSNFLWTMLLGAVIRLGGDPERWSPLMGAAAALGVLALVMVVARRRAVSPALVGLMLAASTGWAAWGTGGLETAAYSLAVTFAVTMLALAFRPAPALRASLTVIGGVRAAGPAALGPYFASAAAFGLASLLRADGVVPTACAAACLAIQSLRRRLPWLRLVAWLACVALFVVPHGAWRWTTYHHILPHTAIVKGTGLERLGAGARYLEHAFVDLHLWLLALPVLLVLAFKLSWSIPRADRALTGAILVGAALYVMSTGGDFMPVYRFVAPWIPLLVYLSAAACVAIDRRAATMRHRQAVRAGLAALVVAYLGLSLYGTWHQQSAWVKGELVSVGWARQETDDWRRIGDLLRRVAQPNDTLATSAGGAIPYRSGLYTIEMNGLTSADLTRFRRRESNRPGHLITIREHELVEHPPQILLGHPLVHPTPASLALGLELRPAWQDRVLANYQRVGLTLPGLPPRFVGCALRNDVADRIIGAGQRGETPRPAAARPVASSRAAPAP